MKKIIAIGLAVSSIFFLTTSKVLAEWSAGVSANVGVYEADGQEKEDGELNLATAEDAKFSHPSLFVEYNFGRVSIGLDVIPGSVTTEENSRTDMNIGDKGLATGNDGAGAGITNKVSVELSRHVSLYALVPITDIGAFARVQIMRMDVETNDSLGSGSIYPDTHMTGAALSLGYQHDTGGAFVRAEVGYTDYDVISVKASNTANTVTADVDGGWARISIGKTF